jgi:tetratricopeptide (TPR) repeat protein
VIGCRLFTMAALAAICCLAPSPSIAQTADDRPVSWPELLGQANAAVRAGRMVQADAMLIWLEQNAPSDFTGPIALARAEHAMVNGNIERAQAAIAEVPKDSVDRCRWGGVHGGIATSKQHWNSAILELAWVVEHCEQSAFAWNLLGLALSGKGEYAASIEAFDTALALRPDDPALLNNRALARIASGTFEKALAELQQARRIAPDDSAIRDNADFLSGFLGLMPSRAAKDGDAIWAARLAKTGDGARVAGRTADATSLFANAALLMDHFSPKLWNLAQDERSIGQN